MSVRSWCSVLRPNPMRYLISTNKWRDALSFLKWTLDWMWGKSNGEGVRAPTLGSAERRWSLVWWLETLPMAGGLKPDDHWGPLQPRPFCDSTNPKPQLLCKRRICSHAWQNTHNPNSFHCTLHYFLFASNTDRCTMPQVSFFSFYHTHTVSMFLNYYLWIIGCQPLIVGRQ